MKHIFRLIFSSCMLLALFSATALPEALVMRPVLAAVNAVRYVSPAGVNSGNCITTPCASIGYAIGRADAGDVIYIAPGTYTENLQIPKSLTLQGAGPGLTIIDGNKIGSVVRIDVPSINVTLIGLTIQNGFASGTDPYGGGIYYQSNGQLTISAVDIINNTGQSGAGGIFAQGQLILNNARVLNNTAGAQGGGGLRLSNTADLTNVTIANNTASVGGGIFNLGTTRLTNVTVAGNHADQNGGGFYNKGVANLTKVVISGNSAQGGGGGIFNSIEGVFTVTGTWLQDNSAVASAGGGINNAGTLTMTTSTLSGNTSSFLPGGGLHNSGSAILAQDTISGNTSSNSEGGAVSSESGPVQITSSTIANNTDPSLKATLGTISLVNSIVADRSGGPNCSGDISSQGYNLETKNACNFVAAGDKINVGDPGLGPLKDNGGPTPTHALAFSSPAVDSGATGLPACQAADQRGITRPQGSGCDMGAYETIGVGSGPITVNVPPNNQCVQTTLSIANSYKIGKLNVGVNATFNPRGGFRVTVISPFPAFKRVTLLGPTGGTAVDLDALFDDSAPGGVPGSGADNINPPFYDNVYQPYNPLSALNGTLSSGMWTLEVCSVPGGSGGTLHNWALLVPEVSTTARVYLPLVGR